MIYRLYKSSPDVDTPNAAMTVDSQPTSSFLFCPDNGDYQQFKQAINDDTAQLEDADGNLMAPADAKAFVATLP